MPKITIAIDPEGCISAANCVGVAPKYFTIGENPYAEVLDGTGLARGLNYTLDVSTVDLALIEEAAESCPTRAILVNPATD